MSHARPRILNEENSQVNQGRSIEGGRIENLPGISLERTNNIVRDTRDSMDNRDNTLSQNTAAFFGVNHSHGYNKNNPRSNWTQPTSQSNSNPTSNSNNLHSLDEMFNTLRIKMRTPVPNIPNTLNSDFFINEKNKISRAINFIFKKNLKECLVKEIILEEKEESIGSMRSLSFKSMQQDLIMSKRNSNMSLSFGSGSNNNFHNESEKLKLTPGIIPITLMTPIIPINPLHPGVKNLNINTGNNPISSVDSPSPLKCMINSGSSIIESNLSKESNMIKNNLNTIHTPDFTSEFTHMMTTSDSKEMLLGKKRENEEKNLNTFLPDVIRKIKTEDVKEMKEIFKTSTGNRPVQINPISNAHKTPEIISNERLEVSKRLLNKNLNRIPDLNSLNIGNNINSNIPITVNPYPQSDSQLNNFHVNMNITNININSKNPPAKRTQAKQIFKCVRDEKLMNDVRELLRKKGIVFNEEHHPHDYTLKFRINEDTNNKVVNSDLSKSYEITVDVETAKILKYNKFKGNKTMIVINNEEESAANLINDELSSLKRDLERIILEKE